MKHFFTITTLAGIGYIAASFFNVWACQGTALTPAAWNLFTLLIQLGQRLG